MSLVRGDGATAVSEAVRERNAAELLKSHGGVCGITWR